MTKDQLITNLAGEGYKKANTIILYDAGTVLTIEGVTPEAHWTEDIQYGARTEITGEVIEEISNLLNHQLSLKPLQKDSPISLFEERLEVNSAPDVIMAKMESGWLHVVVFYDNCDTQQYSSHMGRIAVIPYNFA
jgi:hypothetical protein